MKSKSLALVSLFAVVVTVCGLPALVGCASMRTSPSAGHGILCLTFDDPHWDNWVAAMFMFEKYGAHVSFFPNGELDAHALECLKKLHDAGHAVGPHTLHHADAPEYFAKHGAEAYWQNEVKPQMDAYASVGIVPRAMAYPNNRHTEATDAFLAKKGFKRFRCGVDKYSGYAPQKMGESFVDIDWGYHPASEFAGMVCAEGFGVGEYYQTDIDDLLKGLERAAKNDETMVIYSHDIAFNAHGVDMKVQWLDKILRRAHELGMTFHTLED